MTLREPVKDLSALHQRPVVNLLHFPCLAAGKHDKPAIHELVENVPHDVKIEQAWIGDGTLTFPVSRTRSCPTLPLADAVRAFVHPWRTWWTT